MPTPSAAGKPWEGMHWSDNGTRAWRQGLSDAEVREWRDWQSAAKEAELGESGRRHDGRSWRPIAIGSGVIGAILLGGGTFFVLTSGSAPVPITVTTASPTAVAQPPATRAPASHPPATLAPTQPPPTQQPPTQAPPTGTPDPFAAPQSDRFAATSKLILDAILAELSPPISRQNVLVDRSNDLFTVTGNVSDATPWIDLMGAAGVVADLDRQAVASINADYKCGERAAKAGALVSCNQDQPLEPGRHVIIVTGWNAALPDPFPQDASCSWAVQTNVDNDLATGFPNPPPNHPLLGSDRYFETLMFYDENRMLQNYVLGTDYDGPPRTDTNAQYGNLFSPTRAFIFDPFDDAPITLWVGFVIPEEAYVGTNFSAHGYCYGDVKDPSRTTAIDAIGHPGDGNYPSYAQLIGAE